MTRARIFRLALSLTLALLAVGLGGLSVHRKVESFQPLGFEAVPRGGGLEVISVDHPEAGLRKGDQILLVNGADATTLDQMEQLLRERPESELFVQRGEQPLPVHYQRPAFAPDFPYLLLCLIGAIYLAIGLFTLLRHGTGQGFLFYLWCLVSALVYLLTPAGRVDLAYKSIDLFDTIAYLLLPALTVHLFLVFPVQLPRESRVRRLIPFLYLPCAVLFTLQLDLMRHPTPERYELLSRIALIHFAVMAASAVGVLFWRLRRGAAGWEQQRQMQWMAWGVAAGYVPYLAFYSAPYLLQFHIPALVTSAAVLPLVLVPLTFAYAILRYKLWDIEVIARDTISWTLTLLLGIVGFSLVNLGINRGIAEELSFARTLLSFLSGLGIAGLLVPTRGVISSALERVHYRGAFGKRRALAGFGRELLHERDLGRLCGSLLQRIEDGVDLDKVNLYVAQGGMLRRVRPDSSGEDVPERIPFDVLGEDFWRRDLDRLSGVVMLGEPLSVPTRLFVAGYRYAFPLTVRGHGVGLVLTSFKREDHTPLNSEDVELIRHLLNQAALAIENAQLMGQLQVRLEEVQQLQHYSEGIFESSPAGIAVLDGERRIVSANAAFAALVGRDRIEILNQGLETVLPVTPLPAPGEGMVEASWRDPSGSERYLQLSLAAFERNLYVLVANDVSERVAMENALREKDRLAALGMLAAGVAHEVNTPITGISSYAQMLLEDTAPSDPHYEILKKVERQTFRAARIVNNLLEFARKRQNEKKPVTLAPLLTECLDLLGDRLGKRRIELDWTPPEEKVQVMGCDGELQQVFTNLIVNAMDAMIETGGKLTVRIDTDNSGRDSGKVTARVCDSGPGIPSDKLDMIFQPFYSTKLNRGGTGLGLSISYEIVRRHGGDLRVVSQPGEGACFLVELPRYTASLVATA
jgi:two-component system NtrC family sensor kinase